LVASSCGIASPIKGVKPKEMHGYNPCPLQNHQKLSKNHTLLFNQCQTNLVWT